MQLLSAVALSCSVITNVPSKVQASDLAISPIGTQQINSTSKNPVFFVTDRKETVDGDKIQYVDGRSSKLSYGISYPSRAAPPTTITLRAGATNGSFEIDTQAVAVTTSVNVTAYTFNTRKTVVLTLTH